MVLNRKNRLHAPQLKMRHLQRIQNNRRLRC
jgi:hypothetical protein